MFELHTGDCIDVLKTLPDSSVDAIVTDPPYGLSNTKPAQVADVLKAWVTGDTVSVPAKRGGFMGKDWDSFVPPPAVWEECMRVLKPGGHMAVFSGARTQDLMGLSVRLAGFEIRDTLGWVYGSGFPKSMDISKAIDKKRDDNNDWKTVGSFLKSHRVSAGYATRNSFADKILNGHSNLASAAANLSNWENGLSFPTWERWEQLKGLLDLPDDMDTEVWRLNGRKGTPGEAWEKREVIGRSSSGIGTAFGDGQWAQGKAEEFDVTAPASDAAKRWDGWGTALKPAIEPIILARKPSGGASRLSPAFKYQAKAPKKERPVIVREDGTKIQHATVKPLALMEWLVSLIVPPGGVVLDPFAGLGTTLEAARNKDFHAIGIEREPDYIRLIETRLGI